ncbi:hypothetical protein Q7C36_011230 [Tachysurus vachellii]|uniref:Uncharacterized protein n=1 Tax=Tachysurus vachellii TaxID=175792 RepID=A0AA88SL19_TACVA|nr:hypothetical protein Q7C36_011230 [Tachysurus vachellii]
MLTQDSYRMPAADRDTGERLCRDQRERGQMAELPWGSRAKELTKPVTPTQPPPLLWKRAPGRLWVTVVTQLPRQPDCTSTSRQQQRAGKRAQLRTCICTDEPQRSLTTSKRKIHSVPDFIVSLSQP